MYCNIAYFIKGAIRVLSQKNVSCTVFPTLSLFKQGLKSRKWMQIYWECTAS